MGFLKRLPSYLLPFALGLMEYLVRFFSRQEHPSDFLPAAIATAAIAILTAVVVVDVPQPMLAGLTATQKKTLEFGSVCAFVLILFGIPLWMLVLYETLSTLIAPFGLGIDILGLGRNLTLVGVYYTLCLTVNEIKSSALK